LKDDSDIIHLTIIGTPADTPTPAQVIAVPGTDPIQGGPLLKLNQPVVQ
jgi:hypothetical protein